MATKAYPHAKEWFTATVVPRVKKFWWRVIKKEPEPKEIIECPEKEVDCILQEPAKFSQSVDLMVEEYYADMSSEEAQQHLLNIMVAALIIAGEIRKLTNATLKDEDRLTWGATLEKLTTQKVTDAINRILEEKMLTLDATQTKVLTDYLGETLFVKGAFVPIENMQIKKALLIHPNDCIKEAES